MIRYRRLYESENSDIQLYDTVECAGYDWYVIDIKGDIVTLLAKYNDFGKSMFDEESNDYKTSKIREYLNSDILPKLRNANPIPTRLDDVGVTDRVWLLSVDEAKKPPLEIREFDDWWWLRSSSKLVKYSPPYKLINCAAYVYSGGGVTPHGFSVDLDYGAVRPAMRVRIEDLD